MSLSIVLYGLCSAGDEDNIMHIAAMKAIMICPELGAKCFQFLRSQHLATYMSAANSHRISPNCQANMRYMSQGSHMQI